MAQRVASGCLVFHEGNCLLLRRSALEDTMQGLWEMPAGKIESDLDGSPRENAIRETLEEAGIALGDVVPLGEHLTETKIFYGFLGVSDTADVELSFEHDAFVWMSVPDILAAVAADEMMVGHHTVYFLQQLLDDAEGLIYEAESFAAESGDVRINYNANCPACISIMSLIGEEKRETDPAGTYWGEGAYQNEVEHLQDGTWDFGDGQGRVQLHEPLLVGGIHHNLLGRAGSLLHEYNNNGNGNILEMGEYEECYECGGTGEYDCWSDCDDGKQECYTCDGTGNVEDDEGEDEVCEDCDGSGDEDCSSCDGQTYCEECGGSGEFWNEEIVRGIDNWYQTNVIDYIYAHGDSDIRDALDSLVEGLESGQLRTTYGQEMFSDANQKLYNDLHDAIIYYVINTPNKPLPEGDSHDAETFAADSCIECGRKEGPYADTVLIACPGCPELTCQHCYDEEKQGCVFCIRKRAEEYTEDSTKDTDIAIAQSLFALVTIRDLLMQNMTDEALEFINGEYLPEARVDEIIDDDLRAEVQAFIDSKSPPLSYDAESTSKPARVEIKRATIDPYKLTAVFYDKDDKKIKTTHFGDERYEDYTIHKDKERLKNYNTRHGAKSAGEKWQKPMTAGALSKWILWNKPSLKASFDDYKRRFKLKGDLKAKTSGGRKRAETFATEYTPSQTLGDYDARELALSSVATGDFFTDSLKFSTTRKASEDDIKFWYGDNLKMREAADKIIEILGEPDKSFQREGGFYASLGEPYTSDMVYVLEYELLTDDGPKDNWNFGLQMSRKLRHQGTEPWSDERWTGSPDWPTYAAGAFHLERETFTVTVSEANPVVESVVMDLYQYFADKYGVNTTGFEPAYTVALDEAGTAITADEIEVDTTWSDSMQGFESEEEDAKKLREYEKTYGKKQAKIRMRLKRKIYKERSMGTKAGQWSARKSQKLKREYEKACERAGLKPYKTGKTEKQEDLEDWSDQDWKTSSGKKSSKTGEPYFPAKAVEALKKKGLYSKAKRQKAKATKAGKQNARYSDDIRKVVAKYRAESFRADTDVVLYLGTSTRFLDEIERVGLEDPMLTLDILMADDYAVATAQQYGGNAIVIEVSAFAELLDQVDWQGDLFEYFGDIPPAALYVMDWDDDTESWS